MNRKIGAGMVTSVITLIFAVVGLIAYLINSGTAYFSNLGKDPVVLGTLIVAILALLCWVALGKQSPAITDVLPVIVPALLFVGGILFLNSRINGIAAIMTFTNNAQNMSDMSSAIVAIAAIILGAVTGIISAFFEVRK